MTILHRIVRETLQQMLAEAGDDRKEALRKAMLRRKTKEQDVVVPTSSSGTELPADPTSSTELAVDQLVQTGREQSDDDEVSRLSKPEESSVSKKAVPGEGQPHWTGPTGPALGSRSAFKDYMDQLKALMTPEEFEEYKQSLVAQQKKETRPERRVSKKQDATRQRDPNAPRPSATGAKGPRGLPPSSWGGKRVYDKESGEAFNVVGFVPSDPDEEVQHVRLQSRDNPGKKLRVSYDNFLGRYARHSGQPVKTPVGGESPRVAAWAYDELRKQKRQTGQGEYSRNAPRARQWVDIDPETGEWTQNPPVVTDPLTGKLRKMPPARAIDKDLEDIRADDELVMDKIDLVAGNPKLFEKLSASYISDYKESLKGSMVKAQRAMKEYGSDMMRSGELDPDELQWFKTTPASVVYAAIWELPNFHEHLLPGLGISPVHISTISSIVGKTGKLAISELDNPKTLEAIKTDPGFLTHLSTVDKGKLWNDMRKEAEASGRYRGQF